VKVYSVIVQDRKVHRTPKIENKILVYSKIVKFIIEVYSATVHFRANL